MGISIWNLERVPFVISSIRGSQGSPGHLKDLERYGTGDKDEKSSNGTQIFHWENGSAFSGIPLLQENFQRKEPESLVPFTVNDLVNAWGVY